MYEELFSEALAALDAKEARLQAASAAFVEPTPKVIRIRAGSVQLSESTEIFVLEDSPERIKWFRQRIPHAVYVSNAEQALAILDAQTFDVCFLDHDLTFSDAAFMDIRPGSGQRVAHYLARTRFVGSVVIHSRNETGAERMKALLGRAHVLPFGSFEIELAGPNDEET